MQARTRRVSKSVPRRPRNLWQPIGLDEWLVDAWELMAFAGLNTVLLAALDHL